MTQHIAMRVLVSGAVQGVGFREFVRRSGADLGLSGWVRNLADGRVEAHAEGAVAGIRALLDGCRRGPPGAEVRSVDAAPADLERLARFEIRSASSRPEGGPRGGAPDATGRQAPFQTPDG